MKYFTEKELKAVLKQYIWIGSDTYRCFVQDGKLSEEGALVMASSQGTLPLLAMYEHLKGLYSQTTLTANKIAELPKVGDNVVDEQGEGMGMIIGVGEEVIGTAPATPENEDLISRFMSDCKQCAPTCCGIFKTECIIDCEALYNEFCVWSARNTLTREIFWQMVDGLGFNSTNDGAFDPRVILWTKA